MEKHIRCPYEGECTTAAGFCHYHKEQVTGIENGKVVVHTVYHECNKENMRKV